MFVNITKIQTVITLIFGQCCHKILYSGMFCFLQWMGGCQSAFCERVVQQLVFNKEQNCSAIQIFRYLYYKCFFEVEPIVERPMRRGRVDWSDSWSWRQRGATRWQFHVGDRPSDFVNRDELDRRLF